jgi:hypothetical protein
MMAVSRGTLALAIPLAAFVWLLAAFLYRNPYAVEYDSGYEGSP